MGNNKKNGKSNKDSNKTKTQSLEEIAKEKSAMEKALLFGMLMNDVEEKELIEKNHFDEENEKRSIKVVEEPKAETNNKEKEQKENKKASVKKENEKASIEAVNDMIASLSELEPEAEKVDKEEVVVEEIVVEEIKTEKEPVAETKIEKPKEETITSQTEIIQEVEIDDEMLEGIEEACEPEIVVAPPQVIIEEIKDNINNIDDAEDMEDDAPTSFLGMEEEHHSYMVVVKTGEKLVLDKDSSVIGRKNADIIVKSNYVSRKHAEFIRIADNFFVKDLNTKNGTFVNNQRIPANTMIEIKNGDKIKLADFEMVFKK